MGVDLNDLDLCDCVLYSDGCIGNSDHERRNAEMSALCGTIIALASVCVLLAPWVAEEIAEIKNK